MSAKPVTKSIKYIENNLNISKILGIYVHNYTQDTMTNVATFAIRRLMTERDPIKLLTGDLIAVNQNESEGISHLLYEQLNEMGYHVEFQPPNKTYKLRDTLIVHYVVVDDHMFEPYIKKIQQIISRWEDINFIPAPDKRRHKLLKVIVMD